MELDAFKRVMKKPDEVAIIILASASPMYLSKYKLDTLKIIDNEKVFELEDKNGFIQCVDISSVERVTLNPKKLDYNILFMN